MQDVRHQAREEWEKKAVEKAKQQDDFTNPEAQTRLGAPILERPHTQPSFLQTSVVFEARSETEWLKLYLREAEKGSAGASVEARQ